MTDKDDKPTHDTAPSDDGRGNDGPTPAEPGDRLHRRNFFREGFRQLLRPIAEVVADAVEDRLERVGIPTVDSIGTRAAPQGTTSGETRVDLPDHPVLRPPGALPEREFLERCTSNAQCVSACPVAAIKLGRSDDPRLHDKPFIDPKYQACVVCDDLACMDACPSGALQVVSRESIDMGLAVLREDVCLRADGEDCQVCVDKCPIGNRAIVIGVAGRVTVYDEGCTGCGVCQMYCPTEPAAIVVVPPGASEH